ncbi:efflux RND transporter periplasmic adaptor subunit [Undibacterium sp. LX40W]|uniref:Efflux RND transporter periplasmic adaptor subunit n=1 Tax=Undibacterium nitidum TaxID=2762298 RepID=A0A923HVW9_9BURK|nr:MULTISPECIES: efflux RND transporter periplasmic adaptor subunit [Undibacterium]MBC3881096.1 efflux RND transporter periplasmic adaptor subunit [Undibacterium nitidum]MBC3890171.1 efflux RND transporter periplasmic adaptor subunit [Undibacterium sp. LX40W]
MIRDTSGQDQVIAQAPVWQRKKLIIGVVVGIALVATSFVLVRGFSNSSKSINSARIKIAAVARGNLVRDVAVNGRMVAAISPTLYSTAPSTVTLKVKAGDMVKKGDIVAELESPDLTNLLKREQANYDQLEAEVSRQRILARKQKLIAQRDADQAEIERITAARTFERFEQAGPSGVISKIDYAKAQDALKTAEIRAKHAAAATQLEGEDVDLNLKTKVAQLEQQRLVRDDAKRKVDELKLKAPVDGMVGTLSVANRSVVAANTALMTLVDLSQLEVELEVPESFAADLGIGMTAEISINGNITKGKLSAISPEVVKNQVLARVRFDGAQPAGLRQSQRVSARLLIEERPNVLMVARGPFVESEGGRFVYVVENNIAVRRPYKLGATSISSVEIIEGLKEGDKIVVAGTDQFENAEKISLNN